MYTTEKIKELISDIDLTPENELCKAIYAYTGILSSRGDQSFYAALTAMKSDLTYDPDPHISTLDFKPEDRLAGVVSFLWTDKLTDELHNLCLSEISGEYAEEYFRWHRYDVMQYIERAADNYSIALPDKNMLSFYCPYAFAKLYMAGKVSAGKGVLLRRVNCRPWGIKPFGT